MIMIMELFIDYRNVFFFLFRFYHSKPLEKTEYLKRSDRNIVAPTTTARAPLQKTDKNSNNTSNDSNNSNEKSMDEIVDDERKTNEMITKIIPFKANHPFLFLILDKITGVVCLMGVFADPTEIMEVVREHDLSDAEITKLLAEHDQLQN